MPTLLVYFKIPFRELPKTSAMVKFSLVLIALLCFFHLSIAQTSPEENDAAAVTDLSHPDSESSTALRLSNHPANIETYVPLTKLTFHPINRRFTSRSKKRCHHSKIYHAIKDRQIIPYGNDMLVASGENNDFQNPIVLPERFPHRSGTKHRYHHHEDSGSDSDSDDEDEKESKVLKLMKPNIEQKSKKGSFLKRVRKFLDEYF